MGDATPLDMASAGSSTAWLGGPCRLHREIKG